MANSEESKLKEQIIIDKIEMIASEMAFMSIGSPKEERLKSIIIICYSAINQGKIDELFSVLMKFYTDMDKKA